MLSKTQAIFGGAGQTSCTETRYAYLFVLVNRIFLCPKNCPGSDLNVAVAV